MKIDRSILFGCAVILGLSANSLAESQAAINARRGKILGLDSRAASMDEIASHGRSDVSAPAKPEGAAQSGSFIIPKAGQQPYKPAFGGDKAGSNSSAAKDNSKPKTSLYDRFKKTNQTNSSKQSEQNRSFFYR